MSVRKEDVKIKRKKEQLKQSIGGGGSKNKRTVGGGKRIKG